MSLDEMRPQRVVTVKRGLLVLLAVFALGPVAASEAAEEALANTPPATLSLTGEAKVDSAQTLQFAIRLWGIDTPGAKQRCRISDRCTKCGWSAKKHLQDITKNKEVRCDLVDNPYYDSPMALCYVTEETWRGPGEVWDLNRRMILDGWALASRVYLDDLPERKDPYLAAEQQARKAERGLWGGDFIRPYEWNYGSRLDGCE